MPNQNKPTLDEIIYEFIDECLPMEEAKQAILRYFEDRYIGEDEKQTYNGRNGEWVIAVENDFRAEQRAKLKEDGYIEDEKA